MCFTSLCQSWSAQVISTSLIAQHRSLSIQQKEAMVLQPTFRSTISTKQHQCSWARKPQPLSQITTITQASKRYRITTASVARRPTRPVLFTFHTGCMRPIQGLFRFLPAATQLLAGPLAMQQKGTVYIRLGAQRYLQMLPQCRHVALEQKLQQRQQFCSISWPPAKVSMTGRVAQHVPGVVLPCNL